MIITPCVGKIIEPLSGRSLNSSETLSHVNARASEYQKLGFRRGDRVFLMNGNSIEFFIDLLAIWHLGGCVVPVDGRLTPYEIEILARSALPRFDRL